MTSHPLVLLAALTLLPALARADRGAGSSARSGPLIIELAQGGEPATPAERDPAAPPDASQAAPPPAPSGEPPAAPDPEGRWVYSAQYGWIWVPYAGPYAQVPPPGYGTSHVYVYYPSYGRTWVAAPWVWAPGLHVGIHGGFHGIHRFHGIKRFHDVKRFHGVKRFHRVVPAPRPFHGGVHSRAPRPTRADRPRRPFGARPCARTAAGFRAVRHRAPGHRRLRGGAGAPA